MASVSSGAVTARHCDVDVRSVLLEVTFLSLLLCITVGALQAL